MTNCDLSGKIIFKVKLEDEIKKIVIHNDDINYNELLLMMQRIFSEKIKPNDEFTIKYTDDENDLITLSNDSDVSLALENSKILKLTIFLKQENKDVEEINPSEIVKELQNIRLGIDRFLEKFERSLTTTNSSKDLNKQTNGLESRSLTTSANSLKKDVHSEFDPLNRSIDQTLKQAQNLQISNNSETPDLKSNGISNSIDQHQNSNSQLSQPPPVQPQPHLPPPVSNQLHHQQPLAQNTTPNFNNPSQLPPQQLQQQQQFHSHQQQFPFGQQYGQPQQQPNAPLAHQMNQPQQTLQQQQQPSNFPKPNLIQGPPQPQPGYGAGMPPQGQQQQFNPNAQPGLPPQGFQQPPQQQQQQYQYPNPNQGAGGMNPYSKPPNASMLRPPSTTMYQQGYN